MPLSFNNLRGNASAVADSGNATSPTANQTLVTIPYTALPRGFYRVDVLVVLAGTTGSADIGNIALQFGSLTRTLLPDATQPGVFGPYFGFLSGADTITVATRSAGTAGSIYNVEVIASPLDYADDEGIYYGPDAPMQERQRSFLDFVLNR